MKDNSFLCINLLFLTNNITKQGGYEMHILQKISLLIVIIGALNWGLIGIFNFNLVSFLFDNISVVISRIIYALVGVAGIISISCLFDDTI
jgi:uncharacterized membrane protein YuzA (DUF378 family)